MYNKANKEAKVQETFKAYSVVWECNKGHKNFQTIIGKEGTQHDICLKCGEHYEYVVANDADTGQDKCHIQRVSNRFSATEMAEWFHNNYEEIAKAEDWQTQDKCKVEFKNLPEKNKSTMIKVCERWLNGC